MVIDIVMEKNEKKFCNLLEELQGELKKISVTWKKEEARQGMWDDYQKIVVQIDGFFNSEILIYKVRYAKEIFSFRKTHYSLVKFIKGKVKEKHGKKYYFEGVCQSIDCLIKKIQK